MEAFSVRGEIMRLVLKKSRLEKQEAALKEILAVAEKQLLGLEVEGYQLASDMRMKVGPVDSESESEHSELECIDVKQQGTGEEDLNKTKLNLDSRLDDILSGNYYVEEYDDDEDGEVDEKVFLSL